MHLLVVFWLVTRLILAFHAVGKLELVSLDFNQTFMQAKIKLDAHIEILLDYENLENKHALKLKTNFYSLADKNLVWHECCTKGLIN